MAFRTQSKLAVLLLKSFAKGELPATRVADIAKAASEDGWCKDDPLAKSLSKAADGGKQHALDRVVQAARKAGFMNASSQPYICKVRGPGARPTDFIIFLPHEIYAALVASTQGQVHPWCLPASVVAMDTGLGKTLRDWCSHPEVALTDAPTEIAVLGTHTDGATYTSSARAGCQKSVIVGSCNVISAREPRDRSKRHFMYARSKRLLCDCGCQGYHTYQDINEIVSWSVSLLARGVVPTERHDGSEWSPHDLKNRLLSPASLAKAALLQMRGDWAWMSECFRFRAASQEQFCWMCEACRSAGANCYLNVWPDAPHRATCLTHEAYIQACIRDGVEVSTIFRSPGFKLDYATVDGMHSGDLGPFADASGSLFHIYITDKRKFRSAAIGLQALNRQLHQFYTANRSRRLTRISPLALSQIKATKPGYPFLKTTAAGCRHVAEFGLVLAGAMRDGANGQGPFRFRANHRLHARQEEHNSLLFDMMDGLVSYQRSAAAEPFDAAACKTAMYKFLQSFVRLHDMWRAGVPLEDHASLPFHARPKAHLLQHLVEDKTELYGSPNAFHCYMDEDFVGVIKAVCQASKHPATLERRVSQKCQIMAGITALEALLAA